MGDYAMRVRVGSASLYLSRKGIEKSVCSMGGNIYKLIISSLNLIVMRLGIGHHEMLDSFVLVV